MERLKSSSYQQRDHMTSCRRWRPIETTNCTKQFRGDTKEKQHKHTEGETTREAETPVGRRAEPQTCGRRQEIEGGVLQWLMVLEIQDRMEETALKLLLSMTPTQTLRTEANAAESEDKNYMT